MTVREPATPATVASADRTHIAYQTSARARADRRVGTLRTSEDYLPLAQQLAENFAVHVMDRRGRGGSGPQGSTYSVDEECDDLVAVQAATGATAVFGHSYGGFVALETARSTAVFSHVAVYEAGVSIAGSIPVAWVPRYRQVLAARDTRGEAFAVFVRGIGSAPRPVARLPRWYLSALLRFVVRGERWRRMEPLLEASAAEHEQEARLDDGTAERFRSIRARVLLLGGGKSPAFLTAALFAAPPAGDSHDNSGDPERPRPLRARRESASACRRVRAEVSERTSGRVPLKEPPPGTSGRDTMPHPSSTPGIP